MSEDIAIKSSPRLARAFLLCLLIFSILLSSGIYRFSLSPYFDVKFIEVRLNRPDAPEEAVFYRFKDKVNEGAGSFISDPSSRAKRGISRDPSALQPPRPATAACRGGQDDPSLFRRNSPSGQVNIFQGNVFDGLKFFASSLSPNAKYIVIKKLFPCKVIVYVVERSPRFLVNTRNGILMVDNDFIILPTTKETLNRIKKENRTLPLVFGLEQEFKNLKAGYRLNSSRLKRAKEILDLFNKPSLARYFRVEKINPGQPGRVSVFLSDRTEVILNEAVLSADTDNILTIFSELKKNNIKPRYIDLRFKEPVIGIR